METQKYNDSTKVELQTYLSRLSLPPKVVEQTPDGKAKHVPIGEMESLLDEIFLGMWSTSEFHYQREFNEVIGSLVLSVKHPITGEWIKRTGAASIVIMQDAGSKVVQFNETKKANALDLGFPKLKAECIKNAALSIGNAFGRDLNRKTKATFTPAYTELPKAEYDGALELIRKGKNKNTVLSYLKANFLVSEEQEQSILTLNKLTDGK